MKPMKKLGTAERRLMRRLLDDDRITDPRWAAYIMATVKHETNNLFEPVEEAYWLSREWRMNNLRYAPAWGRGFVQITHAVNYETMSYRLNLPGLASNYDTALDWDVAYEILVVGMLEGLFTGKDLDDYINEDYCDYYRARRIVNGMDRARLIASYAQRYEERIRYEIAQDKTDSAPDDSDFKTHPKSCAVTVLRKNDETPCVKQLQFLLNAWSATVDVLPKLNFLEPDGVFGQKTFARVYFFQRYHSLVKDGVVGKQTWDALLKDHERTLMANSG